jgi:hypothetical protein
MKLCIVLLAAGLMAVIGCVAAAPLPADESGFTASMADRFSRALPQTEVKIVGPLTLDVGKTPDTHQVMLGNVWDYCQRSPENCESEADGFVSKMMSIWGEEDAPVEKAAIRVIVRGANYVDYIRKIAAVKPEAGGIYRPLAGDLWLVCVVDLPNAVRPLRQDDIAKLGLTEEQAIALGTQNTKAALPPLAAKTRAAPQMGIAYAIGDFYDSSRLLLHDDWAELSRKMDGHLMVAVPATDMVVYGDGTTPAEVEALHEFVLYAAGKAPRPISATLLLWTPAGWEAVGPP